MTDQTVNNHDDSGGVVAFLTKRGHRFILISDRQSLAMLVEVINRWVHDPDLDFTPDDREEMLTHIAAAIERLN